MGMAGFRTGEGILGKAGSKCGSDLGSLGRPAQPPTCPECDSSRVWKDGLRHKNIDVCTDVDTNACTNVVQRWICRDCGYRFSNPQPYKSTNVSNVPNTPKEPMDPFANDKSLKQHTASRQVCAEGIDLAALESRKEVGQWEATEKTEKADMKGKIVEFLWYMKKQGYDEDTISMYGELLGVLLKRGAQIFNSENVKETIAVQDTWGPSRKSNAVKAYSLFLKMLGQTWQKPKYKIPQTLPFIPMEPEIDGLIGCCSLQMGTFLQAAKETAGRRGEVFGLKWTDIDLVTNTIRITPEKGSNPRIFRISMKLANMLSRLPRGNTQKVWIYKNSRYLDKQFRRQRKKALGKLVNPRIRQIHFHTLRHWKATMLYHETKDVLYVKQFLGHKSIENTLKYIQLEQALFQNMSEDFICKVAKTLKDATELIEAGFEYVTDMEGCKLFKKRQTSYVGASATEKGSSASMV